MSPSGISNKLPGCIWYGFCHAVCSSRQMHVLLNEVILHSCPCDKTPILMSPLSSSFTIYCTCLTSLCHEMFQYYWIGCLVQFISNGKFFYTKKYWNVPNSTKPLPEPMLTFPQFAPQKHISVKLYSKLIFFHANAFGNFVCNFV